MIYNHTPIYININTILEFYITNNDNLADKYLIIKSNGKNLLKKMYLNSIKKVVFSVLKF